MGYRTLSAFPLRDLWPVEWGSRGTLVLGLTRDLVDEDGREYPATANLGTGNLSSLGFHWESEITVTDGRATAAAIADLPTTDTALPPNTSSYRLYVYDEKGVERLCLTAKSYHLHESLPDVFTRREWITANQFRPYPRAISLVGDYDRIRAMIDDRVPAPYASDLIAGLAFADVPPIDPSRPEFVSTNSPLLLTEEERAALVGTWGIPSSTNKLVTDTDPRVQVFNPMAPAYGATGDGVTNDSTAFLAAFTAAKAARGRFYFPAGRYVLSGAAAQLLLMDTSMEVSGDGMGASIILVASTVGSSTDVIRILPPATGSSGPNDLNLTGRDNRGYYLHDFSILAQSGTPARNGIRIDTTASGSWLHASSIERVAIGKLGGAQSIYMTNSNTDGIFALTMEKCHLFDGLYGYLIGDSIRLIANKFREYTSSNPALEVTFQSGAGNFVFAFNNVYNKYGVVFHNGTKPVICWNFIEGPEVGFVGTDNSALNLKGDVAQITGASVRDNILGIQTGSLGASSLRIGDAADTIVDGNVFTIQTGNYAIDNTSSMVRTEFRKIIAQGPGAANVFKNAMTTGTDTHYTALIYFNPPPAVLAGYLAIQHMLATDLFVGVTNRVTFPALFPGAQIGGGGVLQGDALDGAGKTLFLMQNGYYDGNNSKYMAADAASEYLQTIGVHKFRTAIAGLAGGNIPWIDQLQIDANGTKVGASGTSVKHILHGTATLSSGSASVSFSTLGDANYRVELSGNASETFYWATKTATGFTITSSNGSSTATVDWVLYKY